MSRDLSHPVLGRPMFVAAVTGFVVVAYWDSFTSMWALWQTTDHRHGVIVFPIVAYLVWRLRHELATQPIHADVRGLPVVAAVAALWAVARLVGIQVLEHLAVLAMIPAAVLAFMGMCVVRTLQFPLLFIFLALPISDALIPYLMVITAEISMALLDVSGIAVIREGQYFSLAGGNFVVADVCSGNRYLVTGVIVSLLFGYLSYWSIGKRLLLLAVTIVLLVFANGLRAYIVMAVASATDMRYLGGRDHIFFGWLLFGIVMMLILWIGSRFDDWPAEPRGESMPARGRARASHMAIPIIAALGLIMLTLTVKPLQAEFGEPGAILAAAISLLVFIYVLARQQGFVATDGDSPAPGATPGPAYGQVAAGIATMALLLATPRFTAAIEDTAVEEIDVAAFDVHLDCVAAGSWQGRWQPRFDDPDVQQALSFDCDGQRLNLYLAAYASALQGKELVSSTHYIVPPPWDRYANTETKSAVDASVPGAHVMEITLERSGDKSLIWYWYSVGGRVAAGQVKAKCLQVLALLEGQPSGGAVYVLEARVSESAEISRSHLRKTAVALLANNPGRSESTAR